MAGRRLSGLIRGCRRHPILISAPLAVMAVGAGFGAQALLRPTSNVAEAELLDTLIAQPGRANPTATGQDTSLNAADLTAQRAATAGNSGHGLVEPGAGPSVSLEIRVALLRLSGSPRLGASGPWQLRDRQGGVLQQGPGGAGPDLSAALASQNEVWLETGAGDQLLVDGRAYAGRLRILQAANGLQVINHLPLETYISSVVGAEMPSSWNQEALRAQAVAARSYALAHMARPASEHWHLGDTTRWQAYEGLASVTDSTRQATASTAGIILSYQGGIVESLYAATHQLTVEAHGSLGASMSQHGAQELAQKGLRYNEILGHYYRGASLARLQSGAG